MYKRTRWIISAVMVGGLLLTGTAMAGQNASPPPAHATLAARVVPAVNLDSCPTLVEGDHGGCVSQLQTELNTYDTAGLPVTGKFGLLTQRAVIKFQQETGVIPAQGVVGPHTKATLDQTARRLAAHKKDLGGIYDNIPASSPGAGPGKSNTPHRVAASPNSGETINCGDITCSLYLTRAQTKELNYNIDQAGGGIDGLAASCGLFALMGGPAGIIVATGCGSEILVYRGFFLHAVSHAAGTNGCLRVRYVPGGLLAFYDDHSRYCHNT